MFHSLLIISNNQEIINQYIQKELDSLKIHPIDVLSLQDESITISLVRKAIAFVSLKPFASKLKAVVFNADNFTPDAQQALLKTLEEPPQHTLLLLYTANIDHVLPTIISRCQVKFLNNSKNDLDTNRLFNFWKNIFNQKIGARLKTTTEIAIDRISTQKWLAEQVLFLRDELINNYFHTQHNFSNYQLIKVLKLLQKSQLQISQNLNLKLVLDNLFISL